jgi:hypothetical protein
VQIIKNNSYLENAVAAIVSDSLSKRGCSVKFVELSRRGIDAAVISGTTIVFGAISERQKLDPLVRKYLSSQHGESSRNLIFSVYGEPWNDSLRRVDAITAATNALKPDDIAKKILVMLGTVSSK